ncbi:sensor domain-containing protein [Streptosporangium sp. KLBMP 9127]|nr:sensor domain-containing protein [Streptosporangium sp. KLBMP 9127]
MRTLRHRIAIDTRYLLAGFPAAVVMFCLIVAGTAAGLGSLVAFVGFPILAGTLLMARNFADMEREAIAEVLDRPVTRPPYRPAPHGAGWFRRLVNPLTNGQSWLDLIYAIVAFPISIITFVVTIVWWSTAIAGLTFPIYGWIVAAIPGAGGGLPELLGLGDGIVTQVAFHTALGVLFALTLPAVVHTAALIRAGLGRTLLTRPTELPTYSYQTPALG